MKADAGHEQRDNRPLIRTRSRSALESRERRCERRMDRSAVRLVNGPVCGYEDAATRSLNSLLAVSSHCRESEGFMASRLDGRLGT